MRGWSAGEERKRNRWEDGVNRLEKHQEHRRENTGNAVQVWRENQADRERKETDGKCYERQHETDLRGFWFHHSVLSSSINFDHNKLLKCILLYLWICLFLSNNPCNANKWVRNDLYVRVQVFLCCIFKVKSSQLYLYGTFHTACVDSMYFKIQA